MIQLRSPLLSFALFAALVPITTSTPAAQSTHITDVHNIDTECNAIQNAIMALKPVHVALIKGTWQVLSDADLTVAEQMKKSITFADVWKQGNNYAWVHSHTFDANGNQRATQLCFRQSDGTLERAKQATTVPSLRAAAAKTAYYAADGTILQQAIGFDINDPAIAKKVSDLPYYKVLP